MSLKINFNYSYSFVYYPPVFLFQDFINFFGENELNLTNLDFWLNKVNSEQKYLNSSIFTFILENIYSSNKKEYFSFINLLCEEKYILNLTSSLSEAIFKEEYLIIDFIFEQIEKNEDLYFNFINLLFSLPFNDKNYINSEFYKKILNKENFLLNLSDYKLVKLLETTIYSHNLKYLKYTFPNFLKKITIENKKNLNIDITNISIINELNKYDLFNIEQIKNHYNDKKLLYIIDNDFEYEIVKEHLNHVFNFDNNSCSLFHYLIKESNRKPKNLISFIENNSININSLDSNNESLYFLLAKKYRQDFLWQGLLLGGDPLMKNKEGHCALNLFSEEEHNIVINTFKNLFVKKYNDHKNILVKESTNKKRI